MNNVILSHNLEADLDKAITNCSYDKLFVLTDDTTLRLCWPVIYDYDCLSKAQMITIHATDVEKTIDSTMHVWQCLQRGGATRHSLMINLGGGMVTDLGGFAASTFKRGISFINIPTTLLAMVDASVGGKTGINFGGLKNEIGVFSDAQCVILSPAFLPTLDSENIRSGYAEMLKHGLINRESVQMWHELLTFNLEAACRADNEALSTLTRMVADSVRVKERIVEEDPHEHGLRKALNLGHTVGHAFESWAMEKGQPILHGYAVAYGIVCELYLAVVKCGFPTDVMRQAVSYIRETYGLLPITCDDYPTLLQLMTHDKKNTAGEINFTLLGGIGDIRINQTATKKEIEEALDFYRDGA